MTYILIAKNPTGVVMTADRRLIESASNKDGQNRYSDEGIKMSFHQNARARIGICAAGNLSVTSQNSTKQFPILDIFEKFFRECPEERLNASLVEILRDFSRYANKLQEHSSGSTVLFFVKWQENSFEIIQTNLTVILQNTDNLISNSYATVDSEIFSNDPSLLIGTNFTKEIIAQYSLEPLLNETKKTISEIISLHPIYGGIPTTLTISTEGIISLDITTPPHQYKLLSFADSEKVREAMGLPLLINSPHSDDVPLDENLDSLFDSRSLKRPLKTLSCSSPQIKIEPLNLDDFQLDKDTSSFPELGETLVQPTGSLAGQITSSIPEKKGYADKLQSEVKALQQIRIQDSSSLFNHKNISRSIPTFNVSDKIQNFDSVVTFGKK
jgi:hypothetical protein